MRSSDSAAANALAEVLANDIASGDIDDWEQYLLKGMEMYENNGNQQVVGYLPGDAMDDSYLRKKREVDDQDMASENKEDTIR